MALTDKELIIIEQELTLAIQRKEIRLPAPPEIYNKVAYAIENNLPLESIERIVSISPAVATRILQVANSGSFYGSPRSGSIQNALIRLGLDYVKNVILCVCIRDYYKISDPILQAISDKTWRHSVRVAILAYLVSKNLDVLKSDMALTCGLLHEIGALPVIDYLVKNPQHRNEWHRFEPIIGELGELIATCWNLGPELKAVMCFTNSAESSIGGQLNYRDLIGLIHIYLDCPETMTLYDVKCGITVEMIATMEIEFKTEIETLESALGVRQVPAIT